MSSVMCFPPANISCTNTGIEETDSMLPSEYIETTEGQGSPKCMQESYYMEFKPGKEGIGHEVGDGQ